MAKFFSHSFRTKINFILSFSSTKQKTKKEHSFFSQFKQKKKNTRSHCSFTKLITQISLWSQVFRSPSDCEHINTCSQVFGVFISRTAVPPSSRSSVPSHRFNHPFQSNNRLAIDLLKIKKKKKMSQSTN